MLRLRRTCHAVPGPASASSPRPPSWRPTRSSSTSRTRSRRARRSAPAARVIEALRTQEFGAKTVVVRVNGTDTPHYYRDLIAVVEQAGDRLDAVMLPKVRTPGDVEMTDKLLTPDRARAAAAARADRHRGADRGRDRADRVRGDRGRLAADGDADLRPGRLQRGGRHPDHDDRRRRRTAIPATISTTSTPRWSSPRARRASRRSTARTRRVEGRGRACARARSSPARSGSTASGRSTRARSRSSTRSSRPRASSGSAPRRCSPPTSEAHGEAGRRDVRGRDDRRGQPQDGRADGAARGARRGTRAGGWPRGALSSTGAESSERSARVVDAWSCHSSSRRAGAGRRPRARRARRRGRCSPTLASRSHWRASRTSAKVS